MIRLGEFVVLFAIGIASFAQADELPSRLVVATWNVEWFFDDDRGDNGSDLSREQSAPNRDAWEWKLAQVAGAVAKLRPTILALQEVENRRVLSNLTRRLKDDHGLTYRIAYIEGWDTFTEQDVAVLYQSGLVEYSCREQSREMFLSQQYYNLNKHLFARFEWGPDDAKESLTLLNVHLRATPEAADLRLRQVRLMRKWIAEQIRRGENVIVLGDLNTEEKNHPPEAATDLGVLLGIATPEPSDDLFDLHARLPAALRATHLSGGQFDRILISPTMSHDAPDRQDFVFGSVRVAKDVVIRGQGQDTDHFNSFYQIPQDERDVSDHYPLVAEFLVQ